MEYLVHPDIDNIIWKLVLQLQWKDRCVEVEVFGWPILSVRIWYSNPLLFYSEHYSDNIKMKLYTKIVPNKKDLNGNNDPNW